MLHRTRWILGAALALSAASTGCGPADSLEPPKDPSAQLAKAAPKTPPGHLARAELDRVLVSNGPAWIFRRVMVEHVIRGDGRWAGWRLVGLPEEWSHVDLRPGDVVVKVNGLVLEQPHQAWEAWKSAAKGDKITVSLLRDGASLELKIPIDGAESPETLKALNRPGPAGRAAEPEPQARPKGSFTIGGDRDDDVY
jgi:hypothetical protein